MVFFMSFMLFPDLVNDETRSVGCGVCYQRFCFVTSPVEKFTTGISQCNNMPTNFYLLIETISKDLGIYEFLTDKYHTTLSSYSIRASNIL